MNANIWYNLPEKLPAYAFSLIMQSLFAGHYIISENIFIGFKIS